MISSAVNALVLFFGIALGTVSYHVLDAPPIVAHAESPPPSVHILFAGDMQFDRFNRQVSDEKGQDYLFRCLDKTLPQFDAVVANLEGPITDYPSESVGSVIGSPENFRFTFATTTAETLYRHNIRIVNIGNNHISNFGSSGFRATQAYLSAAGVQYFGGLKGDERVYRTELGGIRISLIGFNEFGGQSAEQVAEAIRTEKASGRIVIVYTHWGDEYLPAADRTRAWGLEFAQAGADAVIGSHPHVVQAQEIIGRMPIFYSLGNFIFDQFWNDDVTHGLAVELVISNNGVTVGRRYTAAISRIGQTCLQSTE